ncbi:MAG TPA: CAP domain-containing protein [Pilimelia sp.]|nr:CAP domain-containing protein [Pilimelia sp.]
MTRLPGPIGLAVLVAVLLVTLGVGAALLPSSFAGRGGNPDGIAGAGPADPAAAADTLAGLDDPGAAPSATPGTPPTANPTPTVKPTPTRPARTAQPKPGPTKPRSGTVAREDEVTALVNQRRASAGCGAVRTDERLRRAARGHSQDMADKNYFSHDSLDGRSPWDRAKAAGYAQPIGENIAKGQRTPAEVVKAWMDSPGHRRNMLNCDAKAIGVGLAYDGNSPIWTQLFGAV